MLAHGLQLRFGLPLVFALVYGNAALATGPLFSGAQYATGWDPMAVTVGDLNCDDWLDLVVANRDNDTVSVLLNNGDGTFATRVDYDVGNGPRSVAVGDLNGDAWLDIEDGLGRYKN